MESHSQTKQTKKRKLNHLTWEEKIQRKKIKNRLAAQTSRDRKKARFEHLELSIDELKVQNAKLRAECATLRSRCERLANDNTHLRAALKNSNNPENIALHTAANRQDRCMGTAMDAAAEKFHFSPDSCACSDIVQKNVTDLPHPRLQSCPETPTTSPDDFGDIDALCLDDILRSTELAELTEQSLFALEELADSLLRDIEQSRDQDESEVSTIGSPAEILESQSSEEIEMHEKHRYKSLEDEVAPYLLLHHEYCKNSKIEYERQPEPKLKSYLTLYNTKVYI